MTATVGLGEVFFPLISMGALIAALVVAGFLAGHLREVKVYGGLLTLLSVSLLSVGLDAAVLVAGGLLGRVELALQLSRLHELANTAFLSAIPFMLATVLPYGSGLRRFTMQVAVAGAVLAAVVSLVAFVAPEAFIAVGGGGAVRSGLAYTSAVGRGSTGVVFALRDAALALVMLTVATVSALGLIRGRITGAYTLVAIGTMIGLAAGGSALFANFTGRYPGPLDGLPFSRVSAGVTVFTLLAMATYVTRFVGQSRRLDEANRELAHRRDRLEFLAYHNGATQMPNRRALFRNLDALIEDGQSADCYLSRIDSLTAVEDSYGALVAEQVLVRLGRRIEMISDSPGENGPLPAQGSAYHIEGSSFAVVFPGTIGEELRRSYEQALIATLDQPLMLEGEAVYLSTSVAYARLDGAVTDPEQLLQRLKRAIAGGRHAGDAICRYSDLVHQQVGRRIQLVQQLRRAVRADEFSLVYHPIVARDGSIAAVEALIRWDVAPPSVFIPLAEESGLIVPITRRVIDTACQDLSRLRAAFPSMEMHINISPGHLDRLDVSRELSVSLERTGQPNAAVTVEITETGFWGEAQTVIPTLQALRDAGFGVAIDDFGTGYSSLEYLKSIPATSIKIDKSFVDELPDARENSVIVDAILLLGHQFNRVVVAEGVESATQRDFLLGRGVDYLQGYLFARPMPIEDLLSVGLPTRE